MSAGGLTGAGGGSIAGTAPPPLARQPDSAALISYAQASQTKAESPKPKGPADQPKADSQPGTQLEERSQKLRDFDAVQGRSNFGEPQQEGRSGDKHTGSFAGCAAGAAKDVVVDTAKGAYETARDGLGAVLDQAGVEGFEGHTERTVARGEAAVDGAKKTWDAATSPVETTRTVYQAGKDEIAEIGAEIDNGDNCALGERVGTAAGVGATIAIPGGAAVKGAKVLTKMGGKDGVDGPNPTTEAEAQDVGKTEETIRNPPRDIGVSDKQAQKKFKHAADLGVEGSYNPKKGEEFAAKIEEFVKDENHQRIDGQYQGQPATIYVDQTSHQAVVVKPDGQYWTNWNLSEKQFEHVIKGGKLGGN